MNDFEEKIAEISCDGLRSQTIEILQVNLGLRCNQECSHCHLEASPLRKETMEWSTMELILEAAGIADCKLVDLTGGAPELNPYLRRFIRVLRRQSHRVQVRTNLTVILEPGLEGMPEFFREHEVQLVASMPCYLEENVRAQRGAGVYEKSIEAIKRLNTIGYGRDSSLPLNLVYNPGGAFLPPPQSVLEEDYRRELARRFGIVFTHLLTITNMPLGRFRTELAGKTKIRITFDSFEHRLTPKRSGTDVPSPTRRGLGGYLFDCDFNLALGLPVNHGAPDHIRFFNIGDLQRRRIVTGEHCFGCTAGAGSSCGGALV